MCIENAARKEADATILAQVSLQPQRFDVRRAEVLHEIGPAAEAQIARLAAEAIQLQALVNVRRLDVDDGRHSQAPLYIT